jgi:uncharacterized protein DUF4150
MAANVYANGMEVSGKASPHTVKASMPDVCLSPPSPPAGPIPVPYPNFAKASDTTDGSKTVLAGGKEISLKGKSSYKKSTGDESATRSFGAGVISHNITGPVKHKAGSFDVKIEGSSVVRHFDLTTGNHSNPGDGCTTVDSAGVAPDFSKDPDCNELKQANNTRRTSSNQQEKKSTVSHAKITKPSQAPEVGWSCSRRLAECYKNGKYRSGLERKDGDVIDSEDRKGQKASNLCNEAREQLQKNNDGNVYNATSSTSRPHTSHTESRVLESLFAGGTPPPGTKVLFAIDWNRFNEEKEKWFSDDNPCDNCRNLICAAQACGITIEICDGDPPGSTPKSVENKTNKPCPK